MSMVWLALVALGATQVNVQFSEQHVNVPGRVLWADGADCNGDGRADLFVVYRRGEEPNTKRLVAWFLQTAPQQLASVPAQTLELPEDLSFAALSDLDANEHTQALFIGAGEVSAWSCDGKPRRTVLSTPGVTPFGENEDLPELRFVGDWHKRGKPELALFTVGALQFFRYENGVFSALEKILVPPTTYVDAPGGPFRGPWSNRRYSLVVSHSFPALHVGKYNSDTFADLFVVDDDRLRVHLGSDKGFAEKPNVLLDFSVRTKEEKDRKNSYVGATLVDLNGDELVDYVINKVSGGLSQMSTETHVHLNRGGFRKQPDQRIARDGFAAMIQLVDLNGDHLPELIEPHADVGLVGLARAMVSKKLNIEWLVTPNEGGRFDAQRTQTTDIVYTLDFSGGPMFKGPFPKFSHDFDGDGRLDMLTSPDGDKLMLFLGQKEGALIEPDAALSLSAKVSPYGATFFDKASQRPHFVSYFRDSPGEDGHVVVVWNRALKESSRP